MNTTNAMKKKSIETVDEDFMVCTDCVQAVCNDDYTALSLQDDGDKREIEIRQGINNTNGHIALGSEDQDREFSSSQCDCCHSPLAGSRHHCVVYTA